MRRLLTAGRPPFVLTLACALGMQARAHADDPPRYETVVEADGEDTGDLPDGRASSEVRPADLERRMPRSAPDAVRYEPGVFVQQTAHGQGSAFLRGLTGQQTLILFDGVRVNNSTYRQGPNQYFFTLDARSIHSLEVLRGGASTRFGSDALGGVILARPIEPMPGVKGLSAHPRLFLRGTTADDERGGRIQLDAAAGPRVSFIGGLGGRTVGLLESGGPIASPTDGAPPDVPRFAEDGRTQLGTGWNEWSADGRLVLRPTQRQRLTLATYLYRELDAPRTDLCPPPAARYDECLTYEEQFRTLGYGAWDVEAGRTEARATLSWQRQHELRRGDRPASYVVSRGRDDVDTIGATARATSGPFRPTRWAALAVTYGADTYHDTVRSAASLGFTDIDVSRELGRGQYLDGSTYTYGGAFIDADARLRRRWIVRAGGRLSWIAARAPGDPASGQGPIDRAWFPLVGHAGAELELARSVSLLANLDRSFRAPNLDDMTSRQQTGPGFQFENAALEPERATSLELGTKLRTRPLSLDAWAFATRLAGAIGKSPREARDCPPDTPQCEASWSRFQLVNARGEAKLVGVEGAARLQLPRRVAMRATAAWTWGDGPNLTARPADPTIPYEARVPLSRVPPANGTVEAYWRGESGLSAGSSLRWALLQDRLAVADLSDARIPRGGTPGYAVVDLRLSYRWRRHVVAALALENVFDAAYRTHGSSVNGPGRGLVFSLELAP